MAPVGMLDRTTSTPLMYTTAPSSRTSDSARLVQYPALGIVNVDRKYSTILLLTVFVASSPWPKPITAGPLFHPLSSYATVVHVLVDKPPVTS